MQPILIYFCVEVDESRSYKLMTHFSDNYLKLVKKNTDMPWQINIINLAI